MRHRLLGFIIYCSKYSEIETFGLTEITTCTGMSSWYLLLRKKSDSVYELNLLCVFAFLFLIFCGQFSSIFTLTLLLASLQSPYALP